MVVAVVLMIGSAEGRLQLSVVPRRLARAEEEDVEGEAVASALPEGVEEIVEDAQGWITYRFIADEMPMR